MIVNDDRREIPRALIEPTVIDSRPLLGSLVTGVADPLLTNLLGYWTFDEALGAAFDATGHGWTANILLGTGVRVSGLLGNALHDPGVGDLSTFNHGLAVSASIDQRPSSAPFSAQIWYRFNGVDRSGNTIAGMWNGGFGGDDWRFAYFAASPGVLGFEFDVADDSHTLFNARSVGISSVGQWAHLVGVWDGTNMFLYANGVQYPCTQLPGSHPLTVRRGHNRLIFDNDESQVQWPSGDQDEGALWARALTPTEVLTLFNSGTGRRPTGL